MNYAPREKNGGGGVKEKGCYESHNCSVKRLDGEPEAA